MTPSLERLVDRIDRLESRMACQDLTSDYCHGFDKRDWERFLSIWWDDCVWDIGPPFGSFTAHAGIERAVKEVLWPAWRQSHHYTTNFEIDFNGADRARGVCDVDCIGTTSDGAAQTVAATYRDRFERRGGVWKIARRDVAIHHFNPIPDLALTRPE